MNCGYFFVKLTEEAYLMDNWCIDGYYSVKSILYSALQNDIAAIVICYGLL